MSELQLGVHIGQQNMTMDELRASWKRFDEAGVDWISVWDHLYEAPPAGGTLPHFEAVATLGALAADTSRARLGCLVFYVGFRNPALLARAAISIDHISNGRFELGLGAGWNPIEARAHGYEFPEVGERLDMLAEASELITTLCTEERTTHKGAHFSTEDASMLPPPVNGRLPLWIGGVGEKRTLRIAAQHASGWNAAYVSPQEFGRLNEVLDGHCHDVGRDPSTIERSVNLLFGLVSDEASMATAERSMSDQWRRMWPRVSEGTLLGTPEMAVEKVLEYRRAGADMVNVALRAPIDPDLVEAYLMTTMPAVRSATP